MSKFKVIGDLVVKIKEIQIEYDDLKYENKKLIEENEKLKNEIDFNHKENQYFLTLDKENLELKEKLNKYSKKN